MKRGRGDHKKTRGLWKRSPHLQQCLCNNITANVRFGEFSDYLGKNSYNFVLKLKRLDERVAETGGDPHFRTLVLKYLCETKNAYA